MSSTAESDDFPESDFAILQTRSAEYVYQPSPVSTSSTADSKKIIPKKKTSSSRQNFIKCREHEDNNKNIWTSVHSDCHLCTRFTTVGELKECVLPRTIDALNLLIALKGRQIGEHWFKGDAFLECSRLISLRWLSCNVYPQSLISVQKHLNDLFEEYRGVRKYSTKSQSYWDKCIPFLQKMTKLFDIQADETRQTSYFKKTGIKHDSGFYKKQVLNPPQGYSTGKIDKMWEKTAIRREQIKNQQTQQTQSTTETHESEVQFDDDDGDEDVVADDGDFVPEEIPLKKKKYEYTDFLDDEDDDMPIDMKNLRSSLRTVRPEVYKLMTLLKSKFHMSQTQAEAAIVHVGNMLFKRKWKFYDPKQPTDKNTLPAGSNMRRVEPYLEAMALASIVEEIMGGKKLVVTYSNDGSAMSGVGSYVVQSFTINNVQRALPTFSIFTESRESLKDLESTTLKILCAAVGYRYTEADILANIDFVMTDSTSHNLNVMESLCDDNGVKHPKALTCNIHPLMMMQRKVKDIFRMIHDTIGADKLKQCFLSDVDFANDDFITKAIHCLSNFINRDCSAKPWNYHSHFNSHIKPRKNMSVILKDHRFNRIFVCCEGLAYHIDDIASYLDTYRNIVNGITILDRSFVEMPILKPIFCAVSLIGIHVSKPFQALLIDVDTKYTTLMVAFPKLYQELITVDAVDMCSTSIQVFHFVSKEMFESCAPDKEVSAIINECAKVYKDQIVALIKMMLSKIADGFDLQRGAVFGFGTHANDDTGPLLKVADVTGKEKEDLDCTNVHNLGEERSVGSINNEIKIRGKRNLESASRKLVLNKSFDLIQGTDPKKYLSFRKPAQDIAKLKNDWLERMQSLEDATFASKDTVNQHLDTVKYKDLEDLKGKGGPFIKGEEVEVYMKGNDTPEEKNKRLYVEVRYAKNMSLRLKHSDPVFRLKRDNRNLSNEEYAENLIQFLGSARKTTSISSSDLTDAISKITGAALPTTKTQSETSIETSIDHFPQQVSSFQPGEHVAIFWVENTDDVVWYLGIVDSVLDGKINILHLKRTDKNGQKWILPDDPEIRSVEKDQILLRNINVMYYGVSCRIEISKAVTKEISECMNNIFK